MPGVLDGIRVLDLSWGTAGPMATMLLADHGADVTKIEPPQGDPFHDLSGYAVWGRSKRNAILDLKDPEDREIFLSQVRSADVLVESFSPGTTERLGIDYATLSALNPQLIYCSITGYGRNNSHSDRPGYDALVAARCGLHWEQRGWPEGALYHAAGKPDPFADLEVPFEDVQGAERPGPLFPASHWPSLGACFAATTAISAALFARETTRRGQHVETSLLQGALCAGSFVWQRAENPDAEGFNTWIFGSKSPKGHFECADGNWIHNWVTNPRFIMTASAGDKLDSNPDLTAQEDPDRFGTAPEEVFALLHYQPVLRERVAKFTASEWVDAAATAGIPLQTVRSPEQALMDPWFLQDGCVAESEHPDHGSIRQVGISYRLDTSPGAIPGTVARPGEHTQQLKQEAAAHREITAPGPDLAAPLAGVKVLDLGLAVAGPYGTQLLSDLGADVIKINALHDGYWHANHIAWMCNRGKRSIALNLKQEGARQVFLKLVATADVVHHNMRYSAAERLGVDYESLKKVNPRLIYCHTRGFEHGPRESLPGNDQTGACLTGIQYEDGGMARGGKPIWSLTSLGDTGNGCLSAIAVIQALYHRARTGEGQMCDTSIVNAGLLNTSYAFARVDGEQVQRPQVDARQLGFNALCRLYETADRWVCVVVANDKQWQRLSEVMAAEGLAPNPRFATARGRAEHDEELGNLLQELFARRPAEEWIERLDAAGVPCEISSESFSTAMFDDPEFKEAQYIASYDHPDVGRLDQVGLLFGFSATPASIQGRPLIVGENTREILSELGYSEKEIDRLCSDRSVLAWSEGEPQNAVPSPWDPAATKTQAAPQGNG